MTAANTSLNNSAADLQDLCQSPTSTATAAGSDPSSLMMHLVSATDADTHPISDSVGDRVACQGVPEAFQDKTTKVQLHLHTPSLPTCLISSLADVVMCLSAFAIAMAGSC